MKRLNLRPPTEQRLPAVAAAWGAAALVLGVMAWLTAGAIVERTHLRIEQRGLVAEVGTLQTALQGLRERVALASAVQRALAALRAREARRELAAVLEGAIPDGVWLTALTVGPTEARMTGSALRWQDIHRFVETLRGDGVAPRLGAVTREPAVGVETYRFALTVAVPGRRP